jgi:hypothetical protein
MAAYYSGVRCESLVGLCCDCHKALCNPAIAVLGYVDFAGRLLGVWLAVDEYDNEGEREAMNIRMTELERAAWDKVAAMLMLHGVLPDARTTTLLRYGLELVAEKHKDVLRDGA